MYQNAVGTRKAQMKFTSSEYVVYSISSPHTCIESTDWLWLSLSETEIYNYKSVAFIILFFGKISPQLSSLTSKKSMALEN